MDKNVSFYQDSNLQLLKQQKVTKFCPKLYHWAMSTQVLEIKDFEVFDECHVFWVVLQLRIIAVVGSFYSGGYRIGLATLIDTHTIYITYRTRAIITRSWLETPLEY